MSEKTKKEMHDELEAARSEVKQLLLVIRTKDDVINYLRAKVDHLATEDGAIEVLERAGFHHFIEAKLEDVREKNGKRWRTFRNHGRYATVLAKK